MGIPTAKNPEVSIIIPVLNESGRINLFLDQLKSQVGAHSAEIIVIDGAADGGTIASIIDSDIIKLTAPKGRARQMNAGAGIAKSRILLFLHADAYIDSRGFDKIFETMHDHNYVGGAFKIRYDSDRFLLRLIAMRSNLRCQMSRIPYGDQGIFIRKEYFEHIGGYSDIEFLEDVDLMRRIKRDNKKIRILKNRITVSARRWEREGILYGTIRNNIVVTLFHFGVHPNKLAKFYK